MLISRNFPLDGEYEFAVTANGVAGDGGRGNSGLVGGGGDGFGGNPGAGESAPALNITLDDQRLITPNPRSFRVPIKAGPTPSESPSSIDGQPRAPEWTIFIPSTASKAQ